MNVSNVSSPTIFAAPSPASPEALIASLTQENKELREKIEILARQVDWFQRQIFGPRSERRAADFPSHQLSLFTEEQFASSKQPAPPVTPVTVPAHTRKPHPGKKIFPSTSWSKISAAL